MTWRGRPKSLRGARLSLNKTQIRQITAANAIAEPDTVSMSHNVSCTTYFSGSPCQAIDTQRAILSQINGRYSPLNAASREESRSVQLRSPDNNTNLSTPPTTLPQNQKFQGIYPEINHSPIDIIPRLANLLIIKPDQSRKTTVWSGSSVLTSSDCTSGIDASVAGGTCAGTALASGLSD